MLKTRISSEVYNGVQSIDFKKENRLFAIITTKENILKLKKCAIENGLDDNLIMTHEEFLNYCKNKFLEQTIRK